MLDDLNRREFIAGSAAATLLPAHAVAVGAAPPPGRKILNYNPNMEYRRLGKTGLMVSAICMGGHWKRVGTMVPGGDKIDLAQVDHDSLNNQQFLKNRHDILTAAIDAGINYLDACTGPEVLTYSRVLKGRRDRIYLGYSWHVRESRRKEWRSAQKLVEGFSLGLKEAGLEYADLWRITLPMDQGHHQMVSVDDIREVEEGAIEAMRLAKKQGKARFTGVSSHNRTWLKSLIDEHSDVIDVVLFPYTATTRELPNDSIFRAVRKHDIGVFGIKPFADNSLFKGNGSTHSPMAAEDDRRARLAIRNILANPAITAPIPGLINAHQVQNVSLAVRERRQLDRAERAELEAASEHMWANLSPSHQWLRDWQFV
jgi:hypothetical protein